MSLTLLTTLVATAAGILGAVGAVRFLLLTTIRLDPTTAAYLWEMVRRERWPRFMLSHEYGSRQPNDWRGLIKLTKIGYVYLSFAERLMTAGFVGKEMVCVITCFRWRASGVFELLDEMEAERRSGDKIAVELVSPYGMEPLGYLPEVEPPYLTPDQYEDISVAVARCAEGKGRTGIILHGPPGCGKTSLVKWLARRHKMPVRLFTFTPKLDNESVTKMFARLPARSIVLFEDFDSHWNGRTCVGESLKTSEGPFSIGTPSVGSASPSCGATFDSLLNGFDGVYNNYEGVVFIMTVNDLSKVDDALKKRPSRFRFIREIGYPCPEIIRRVMGEVDPGYVGLSLDTDNLVNKIQEFHASSCN